VIIYPCVFAQPSKNGSAKLQTRKPEYVKESWRRVCRRKGVESGKWVEKLAAAKNVIEPTPLFLTPFPLPHPQIQSNFLQVADIKAILYLAKCHRRLKNTQTQRGIGSWRGVGKTIKISL